MLDLWNLPASYKEVVLHQEDEEFDDPDVVILCMVRLVDQACIHELETHALGLLAIDLTELRLVLEDVRADRQAKAA